MQQLNIRSSFNVCRSTQYSGRTMTVEKVVLIISVLALIVQTSTQEVEFVDSPSSYYYLLRGTLVVIPCLALQVVPNSNQLTLNATFFRNSTPINVYDPPPLHFVHVDSFENVIGLGVFAAGQDNHTTYHCMAGGITSTQTRIFVGDGLPLKLVDPPVQITETLYSVTIAWGYSPAPTYAPLLGYSVTLRTCDQPQNQAVSIEINSNETETTLLDMSHSTTYCITVGGWSSLGTGARSEVVMVTTISALVPPAPTQVIASVKGGVVNVTWEAVTIEYDVMTPLQDYLIRYGVPGSTYSLTATLDNTTTQFKVFIKDSSKDLLIGIAARNSVGHSQFTYTGIAAVTAASSSLSVNELLVLLGTVAAVLVIFIVLAICIIALLCCRSKIISSNSLTRQNSSLSTSQSTSRISTPQECKSPTLQIHYNPFDSSYSSSELRDYLSEPRKTGSPLHQHGNPSLEMLGIAHTTFR